MKLVVDKPQRQAKMRAHTATHLLHYALDRMLWGTKQAWSLVDDDYLRFDFASKDALTPQQLLELEYSINTWIAAWVDVMSEEMSMDEASKTWAKAFFEDKYGDTVRVVQIQWEIVDDLDIQSIELCGGTHVSNTAHIWVVKITNHSSVASGIRRIEAVTATKVAEYGNTLQEKIQKISTTLDCQPAQLEEKLDKILKEKEHLESDHASLQDQILSTHLDELAWNISSSWAKPKWNGGEVEGTREVVINASGTSLEHHNFKEVVNTAKSRRSDRNRIIYNDEGNFAIYTGTWDMSAKEFAKSQWLKGGGSDQFVQGKDEKIATIL